MFQNLNVKSANQIILIIIFFFLFKVSISQQNCKVLKPELDGVYKGNCKKGLANGRGSAIGTDSYTGQFVKGLPDGKGTYTWATGESYTGYWKKGKRHGSGDFKFPFQGKDSIVSGNWENDRYIGKTQEIYTIIHKSSVDRYKFQKTGDIRNRVLINFYQNGVRNFGISNFLISSSSGHDTSVGNSIGFDEIVFPVRIRITYTTLNKLRTATYDVEFEFEISEPGNWSVDLHN